MLKGIICAVILCGLCAGVQAQQFAIRAERRGNVFLIGWGVPAPAASSETRPDSGKLSGVCVTPRANISFFFSDGDEHKYLAREGASATSFSVLLRGKTKLPAYKQPTWSILDLRDRAYGDTVLLQKLLTKQLVRLEYSREEVVMDKGKQTLRNKDAVVMKISNREAEAIRRQLEELD